MTESNIRFRPVSVVRPNVARAARRARTLLFALALGAGLTVAAERSEAVEAPAGVTIDALVADVLARNPEARFYEAEVAAAKGQRVKAGVLANPELQTTVGSKRVTAGGLSDEGVAWSVSVRQTFEWPGRIALRKAIAGQQLALAELGLERFRAALRGQARILAYNLAAARENAAAAAEVAARLRALREVLVQRDPAGLAPVLETRIVEATELTLERRASEAAVAEHDALLQLNQLRGRPWSEPLAILPPAPSFPPAPAVDALVAAADRRNFDLQVRRAELKQQGLKVSLSNNEAWPAVTVGPYVSREQAADVETQAGISLSVPVPAWDRNAGAIATERAREIQAETSLGLTRRQVERQIVANAFVYETAVREIGRWKPDAIEQFRAAAAVADKHYRLGAVPIATYVELQKQYLDAVTALLDARRTALVAAQELESLTAAELVPSVGGAPGAGGNPAIGGGAAR